MIKLSDNVQVSMDIDTYPEGAHTDSQDIEAMFDEVPRSSFIESMYDWWNEKGFLTAAQYDKLQELDDDCTFGSNPYD